jgi:DNA-binding MarR family transcriptional regulator
MDFDEHLTSPARLTILAILVPGEAVSFTELKRASGLADGNLHVQTRKLHDSGYLEISRRPQGKRTVTRFRITEEGLAALKLHVRKLEAILATESGRIGPLKGPRPRDASQVWSD